MLRSLLSLPGSASLALPTKSTLEAVLGFAGTQIARRTAGEVKVRRVFRAAVWILLLLAALAIAVRVGLGALCGRHAVRRNLIGGLPGPLWRLY